MPVYGTLTILKFYVSDSRMQNIDPNPNDVHLFGGAESRAFQRRVTRGYAIRGYHYTAPQFGNKIYHFRVVMLFRG